MLHLFFTDSEKPNEKAQTKQVVVLLHGFCETGEIWQDFVPTLSKHFRVIVPDLGGFGQSATLLPSSNISNNISIEDIASQVVMLLDFLEIKKAIFIGHSLGGYVVLAMQANEIWQKYIQKIGLFHSSALADSAEKKHQRNKVIEHVKKVGVERYIESFVTPLFSKNNLAKMPEKITFLENICKKTPLQTILSVTAAMRERPDTTQALAKAQIPVLFIIGKDDNAIPLENYEKQIFMPPNATIHILADVGHLGMLEKPAETLKIVLDFCFMVFL